MPKLIKILAASACSGFLVGAAVRVGQSMAVRASVPEREPESAQETSEHDHMLEERLRAIERRLTTTESAIEARKRLDTPTEERIARLETKVAGQSSAIADIRECSLRNEESVRRLLGSLERLIDSRAPLTRRSPEPVGTRTS